METPQTHAPAPAVFLDRDGTIIEEVGYIQRPEQVRLLPGAVEGLRRFQQCGYFLIVISNQSGVARGFFEESAVHQINATIDHLLRPHHIHIHRYYYCPHHPEGTHPRYRRTCRCRKPEPGMIEQAMAEFPIDLSRSVVIGDKLSDIQLGQRLGLKTILVLTGYGKETLNQLSQTGTTPEAICPTLQEAAETICDTSR